MPPRFTVDVGNSSVGVCDWGCARPALRRLSEPAEAARVLQGEVAVISVAPRRLELLLATLDPGVSAVHLAEPPAGLGAAPLLGSAGADRIAVALALQPGPAVAVDAGTAVTVEIVDAAGCYLGGFIAPGPRAALEGLVAATAQLPRLEVGAVPVRPGGETATALRAGTWGLVVGGVDRLVEAALEALGGRDAAVVATGGWGEAWAQASRLPGVRHDPLLVHRGIRRWAQAR